MFFQKIDPSSFIQSISASWYQIVWSSTSFPSSSIFYSLAVSRSFCSNFFLCHEWLWECTQIHFRNYHRSNHATIWIFSLCRMCSEILPFQTRSNVFCCASGGLSMTFLSQLEWTNMTWTVWSILLAKDNPLYSVAFKTFKGWKHHGYIKRCTHLWQVVYKV